MRPIDADALLVEAKRISGPVTGDGWDNFGVYALIERQKTVDAVPVTRCEYCYAYRKDKELARAADLDEDQYCALLQCEMPPNGYCYYGKKKEDIRKKTVEDKA